MIPKFKEVLSRLIDQSVDIYDLETIISAIEIQLAALKEQRATEVKNGQG